MPIVNFKLEGELLKFVDGYIKSGLATSKAEVIRLALLRLRENSGAVTNDEHDKSIR